MQTTEQTNHTAAVLAAPVALALAEYYRLADAAGVAVVGSSPAFGAAYAEIEEAEVALRPYRAALRAARSELRLAERRAERDSLAAVRRILSAT